MIKKSSIILIILMGFLSTIPVHGYTVRMNNKSNATFNPEDVHVHTTLAWCPDSRNENILEPLIGYYEDRYESAKCRGACFDWFEIKGHKFYIPNQCRDVNIDIKDDGVYLNGNPARAYGDFVGFMKDVGLALHFEDIGNFVSKEFSNLAVMTKNLGEFVANEFESVGHIIKGGLTGDEEEVRKGLQAAKDSFGKFSAQIIKSLEMNLKNVIGLANNVFTSKETPEFCVFSAKTKHENMPKTIDDAQVIKQDKEGYIELIKKYAPITYLDKTELYYPIWPDEYFTSPTTRIKSMSTGMTYLQGKITFEKMYEMYTQCETKDLYFENDKCVIYGSNPDRLKSGDVPGNKDSKGNLTVPIFVITTETEDKIYLSYMYFYGVNGAYDVGPFKGHVHIKAIEDNIQNYHESDLEHISIEFDKKTKEPKRIYYGSHGNDEGFWFDWNSSEFAKEDGTHPIVYVAHGGHGLYPKEGTYVRIMGLANDITTKGRRWEPTNLIRVYRDNDARFDHKTMGWLYWPGPMGAHGVGAASDKPWFTQGPHVGDLGRDPKADSFYCENPTSDVIVGDVKYENCIRDKMPYAQPPGMDLTEYGIGRK